MTKEDEGSPRVYLSGLPPDVTKATLRTFFSDYGTVLDVIFKFGADSKRFKGVAYVLFESQDVVDKLLEEATVTIEDQTVEVKKAIDGKGEEPLLAVPKEALKCYACKRSTFPSLESFINHKRGKQHQALVKLFKAKSSSVLHLLRAEAKLASDRSYDIHWMKAHPDFNKPRCEICQVQISCNPAKHNSSVEHKMVKNYMNQKCCDIDFSERWKYEAHLLTLKHLKTVYEKEQQNGPKTDETRLTMKKAIDIYKQCDQDLKELKETYGELDFHAELPAFDKKPIGLNFVVKKINYYCICCDQKFFANMNLVEPHCRSYSHYTNMTDHITEVEKTVLQKRKLEGAENPPSKKKAIESPEVTTPIKEKVKEKEEKNKEEKQEKPVEKTKPQEEVKDEDPEESMEDQEEAEDQEDLKEHDEGDVEMDNEEEEEEQAENEEEAEPEEVVDIPEEEPEEDEVQEVDGTQEEVGGESDVQAEEDDDIQLLDQEETEDKNKKDAGDDPVEETKEEEEEEEEVVEVEKPSPKRPARARRGRARGRGLKR